MEQRVASAALGAQEGRTSGVAFDFLAQSGDQGVNSLVSYELLLRIDGFVDFLATAKDTRRLVEAVEEIKFPRRETLNLVLADEDAVVCFVHAQRRYQPPKAFLEFLFHLGEQAVVQFTLWIWILPAMAFQKQMTQLEQVAR